jgi:protoporphyrinogen oxidase
MRLENKMSTDSNSGFTSLSSDSRVGIIGGGPAGLTAAYLLAQSKTDLTLFEGSSDFGGISRTVEENGWRFDIGGHRFFTKVERVEEFWNEILGPDDFLLRPRMSRIFYNDKFFDYPLRAINALKGLGLLEACRCVGSYMWVRIFPPKDQTNFEGWVASRFGWRLYSIFFKTYTEKVWGISAKSIQASWAAQRIKNLSLPSAIWNALKPKNKNQTQITSLIEQFRYPKFGPGMMWETCATKAQLISDKTKITTGAYVKKISKTESNSLKITYGFEKEEIDQEFDHLISSMPLRNLILSLAPKPPIEILEAAQKLKYRDFLTVALVVPMQYSFPDNWIYIHSSKVKLGRVQNYGSWSPYLIKNGYTCLGLEYFVNSDEDFWQKSNEDLIQYGQFELESINLIGTNVVSEGYVVRQEKAYPVYDSNYQNSIDTIKSFLMTEWPNLQTVGRNGLHRYNNADHSMLTAMVAVDNLQDKEFQDVWTINVDEEFQEVTDSTKGSGRAAPIFTK